MSSTVERRQETINANGVLQLAGGNLLRVISSTANLDIRLLKLGTTERISGVTALIAQRVIPFDQVQILAAAGTVVVLVIGQSDFTEDFTDVPVTAITITGVGNVYVTPSDTIANTAPVDCNTAAEAVLVAANANRRRVRITADSANADGGTTASHGGLIRRTSGGNAIAELQAGTSLLFETRDQLFVRNDSGSTNRFYVAEET